MSHPPYAANNPDALGTPQNYLRVHYTSAQAGTSILAALTPVSPATSAYYRIFRIKISRGDVTQPVVLDASSAMSAPIFKLFGATGGASFVDSGPMLVDVTDNLAVQLTSGAAGVYVEIHYSVLNRNS